MKLRWNDLAPRGAFKGAALSVLVLALASCGDKKQEEPTPDLSKFSGIYASYLKSCAECHEPGTETQTTKVPNLDLSSEQAAYDSLLLNRNLKPLIGFDCPTLVYVKPGFSAQSILYAIMDVPTADTIAAGSASACKATYHTRSSSATGMANDPTPAQKEAIKAWIDKGAPRN